ncbi:hypothetical protein HPB47_005926 [Ixodes persulcatus]|uniref:Uncharacterized protein n=1 Tax=Ixodes persulcatus TaxID=34615 RepID=A0AC60PC22_IXOPE|nr:hypothetical protein HPB47_005926 [Ixodes persulcatus]
MSTPTKAQWLSLNIPVDTPVDAIMDSIQAVAGGGGRSKVYDGGQWPPLNVLERKGSCSLVTWKTPWSQWEPTLCSCILQVLEQYGKVKAINHATFRDRPDVRMSKQVPNFVHVQGQRVMVDYRGLCHVCSRCGLEGHIGPACKTPRCDRCGVFGHATTGCTAPSQRCGHGHATTACVQPTQRDSPTPSAGELPPPSPSQPPSTPVMTRTRPSARGLHHLPLLSRTPTLSRTPEFLTAKRRAKPPTFYRTQPPLHSQTSDIPCNSATIPGSEASCVPLNAAATPDSQTSDASSNAAATLGSRGTNVDDLSADSDPLFISQEGDVTSGQGHPPSTPEASTTTTSRESSAESASPEDADMPDDRSNDKHVISPAGGGSNAAPASSVKKKRLSPDNFDYAESLEF